jgi:putative 4-mercaptohistidine N1-methyltranferase
MDMTIATSRVHSEENSSLEVLNPYESNKLLNEYLLFHYGTAEEVLPHAKGPKEALDYPVRCVRECLDVASIPAGGRALDLGCAVGRATFELARHCVEVLGIDYSHRFVAAAEHIRREGSMAYERVDEGNLTTPLSAQRPAGVDGGRLRFEQGDAMALRRDLGRFEVVLMANLIDRLQHPSRCLERLPDLVQPNGVLVITSPYTWLEAFTPQSEWLGGFQVEGRSQSTLEGLRSRLEPAFTLERTLELPFLIREHARKYQWSVAQASVWRRLG